MKERVLYWTPRVLMILALLFMLMFSFDVFEGNEPLGRKLLGFLISNIPVFILTAIFAFFTILYENPPVVYAILGFPDLNTAVYASVLCVASK